MTSAPSQSTTITVTWSIFGAHLAVRMSGLPLVVRFRGSRSGALTGQFRTVMRASRTSCSRLASGTRWRFLSAWPSSSSIRRSVVLPPSTRVQPGPPSRSCRSTTWEEIVAANPSLATLQPDVEALLVRADPVSSRVSCFLVPIDDCYELVGHLRRLWRGFDGGRGAHAQLDAFFARVRGLAR